MYVVFLYLYTHKNNTWFYDCILIYVYMYMPQSKIECGRNEREWFGIISAYRPRPRSSFYISNEKHVESVKSTLLFRRKYLAP